MQGENHRHWLCAGITRRAPARQDPLQGRWLVIKSIRGQTVKRFQQFTKSWRRSKVDDQRKRAHEAADSMSQLGSLPIRGRYRNWYPFHARITRDHDGPCSKQDVKATDSLLSAESVDPAAQIPVPSQ